MPPLIRIVVLAVLLAGNAADASERSELLSAQGLVKFHAQQYEEALRFFDAAVEADPADASALYNRGLCHARLEQPEAAIRDFRAALTIAPALDAAALQLGVALVETSAYADAIAPLEQAQRADNLASEASLFLGIALLRLHERDRARAEFQRAARDPAASMAAEYYLGVLAYQEQRRDEAVERFANVAAQNPDSALGREAVAFLERLRADPERWYQLYASLGLQYDSNVVLAPATDLPSLGITQQADGRVVMSAGADLYPWRSPQANLLVGYNFFQSLHFELHDFNLQEHRATAQFARYWPWVRAGLLGRYSYYLLETDSFLQEVAGVPWLTVDEGDLGQTEMYFRTRYRDFLKLPYNPQLNAVNYAVGLRQLLFLGSGERFAAVGYQFDRQDPTNSSGAQFGYNGNEVNAGIGWNLPASTLAEASYAFRYESYDSASEGRTDTPSQVLVSLRTGLTNYLALSLAYFGTFHDSNRVEFDYNRHIGSVILEVIY
jgi:tetratricopeptide (TPR) repeat protein